MTERPRVAPDLLAALLEAAPGRVRRKLDAEPRAAEEWEWTSDGQEWTVTAGGETVTLTGPDLTDASQVGCTCLLSPRCLHLLRAVSLLPHTDGEAADPADAPEGTGGGDGAPRNPTSGPDAATPPGPDGTGGQDGSGSTDTDPLSAAVETDGDARAAAALAWDAGARTLAAGVRAAGSSQRAELLRAAALARAARLPRLAAACTTVATGLRDHATPDFSLAEHAAALTRLLDVSRRLGGGPDGPRPAPTLADVGTGRRAYAGVGSLRLYGLGSERVATASGYAGVVTHAVSLTGGPRLWRVGDVAPGDDDRVAAVYGAAVSFGGASLSHRDLGRSGMVAQRVSASADGRLRGGAATTAAVTDGCAWDAQPLAVLWERPLAAQVERSLRAQAAPAHRTGADLVFADLVVTGAAGAGGVAVLERVTGRAFTLRPSGAADLVRARNLPRLAAEPGLGMRAVARPVPESPGTLVPVTVSAPDLALPAAWRGRANLSLDTLPSPGAAHPSVPVPAAGPGLAAPGADPGLAALERRLNRLAEAGREAVPADPGLETRLWGNHLPTAAVVLSGVGAAARERARTATGESVVPPPDRLAVAWLAAATYLATARHHLHALAWAQRVAPA
ncbi:hypothetical protein [Nocardiopsis halotolerans]|uniref:hypothetical protein n=1 Tax=Nocardiopsis halotolerans TaxID=124252 RepID=UPI00034A9E5A|nr:hypothetical protein [Nocardiopsis halotolerans]